MLTIYTIDLNFQGEGHSIASFLLKSESGLILVETGPFSTYNKLKAEIKALGFRIEDVKHVLLSHIHFDHAGAAWKLAELGANIYVNPHGIKHLANPEKLWNSAAQIYGDKMDELWGQMKPIEDDKLKAVGDGDVLNFGDIKVVVHYTPGHAVHHNAYQIEDFVFTGDVAGVRILNGPVMPPCPPPDINIELWKHSISKIKGLNPSGLYLTHYGLQTDAQNLLSQLDTVLDSWANEIYVYYKEGQPQQEVVPKFMAFVHKQLKDNGADESLIKTYEYANPSWMSVAGLYRYWKLKEDGRL